MLDLAAHVSYSLPNNELAAKPFCNPVMLDIEMSDGGAFASAERAWDSNTNTMTLSHGSSAQDATFFAGTLDCKVVAKF